MSLWSNSDIEIAIESIKNGKTYKDIGEILNRTEKSVCCK